MDDGPIQLVVQPVTIVTMLNNEGLNIGVRLNFVTCEQTFSTTLIILTYLKYRTSIA